MACLRLSIGLWGALPFALFACQPAGEISVDDVVKQRPVNEGAPSAGSEEPVAIDWASEVDCRGKLGLLQQALAEKRIDTLDGSPFALIGDDGLATFDFRPSVAPEPWQPAADADRNTAARCIIRLGRARNQMSDHHVLRRNLVRSAFQSGTRAEKNPAYDVAKARLKQAERKAKPGKSSIIKVGDPLIDLVGMLVGGAITGLGQWGVGDDLEEALDTLMATPRSIEQPRFRSYQFERTQVRASREAIMPIVLTDRRLQKSWRTTLRRREVREFLVLNGLDRQDRDYAVHRQAGIAEEDLHRWKTRPPVPPLDELVAGLLEAQPTASMDRVAWLDSGLAADDGGLLDSDAQLDAAALPVSLSRSPNGPGGAMPMSAATERPGPREAAGGSIVTLESGGKKAEGVYVSPSFVLVSSGLIGKGGLVEVENREGRSTLGLVAALDRGRGLALIQVPRRGQPVALEAAMTTADGPKTGFGMPAGYAGSHQRPSWPSVGSADHHDGGAVTFPLLDGNRLVGFRPGRGPDIPFDDIKAFLDDQRHLVLADR